MSQEELTSDSVPTADGMPTFGLGTWQNDDPEQCTRSVATALEMGYRHVDTAQAYGNEEAVGDGIARADVDREDVFLATKVWTSNLAYDDVKASTERSLEKLGVDYLDLLYVHWPAGEYDPAETLAAFDELADGGTIRNVGVSNFQPEHVDEAIETLDAPVFANQVECHPLLPQDELRAHCEDVGVNVVAYSPLARGKVFDVPEIRSVAEKHGVSEAQVSLAWLREKGITVIPKATSEAHIRDNWESLALDLDDEDVAAIDGIEERGRQVDPSFAPW
ncbi:aldo/keto reductase [Haloarchaeobius sp. HRN-SO-5]|uniref:aldo/keto reductase n=1 Tax=Haloarchaeobius sp. HRN-SO-5 TaxID=3446118 RepID=UPI003EBC7D08